MKGLELSRKFYKECGEPMLQEQFSDILPFIAVGLVGSGSECYGYDDEISRDHDFEPGFCIFIPDESIVDSKRAFEPEKAYARLPREFMGFNRSLYSAVGGNRHGVIKTADFFEAKVGSRDGILTIGQWLTLPDYALAEAHTKVGVLGIKVWICNGEVYGKRDLSPNAGVSANATAAQGNNQRNERRGGRGRKGGDRKNNK
jgi:hypothetical protein